MPRFERVKWSKDRKRDFVHWISHELHQTEGDRTTLVNKWEDEIIQWRAALPDGELDFPYPGASNLEMPLTAMHSDPVYADFIQTLHAPEEYWSPVAKRADRVDAVTPMRKAVAAIEKRMLKMRRVNSRAILDNNVLGTAIYKNHWWGERAKRKAYGSDGQIIDKIKTISQPRIEHIPLQRFWIPADAWEIDPDAQGGARWTAHEIFKTKSELRVWAEGSETHPAFDRAALDTVLKFEETVDDEVLDEQQRDDKYIPFENERIRLFEVYARFDVDGDGIDEDVVAIVHKDSLQVLRALHNPFMHEKRPFHKTNYLPGFGFYGIGISESDAWAQLATTKMLNAQIDNMLLANTRMLSAPLGSNIEPGEPWYPSKIWLTEPGSEVKEIRMADIYPSIFQGLSQMMQFSEMRTGVSELRQGNLSGLPSRTPATSLLSILQEGNKRFDMILGNFRDVHGEMGLRMLQNVAQDVRENPTQWMQFLAQSIGQEDTAAVMAVLTSDVHALEENFGMSVTATSAQTNKEIEKQSFIGLMQIVNQTYSSLVQSRIAAAQIPDPIVQEVSNASFAAGVELLKRLLERFDVQNPSEYLGNLEAIASGLNAQAQGGNAATAALPQGLLGISGLGALGGPSLVPGQPVEREQIGGLLGL